MFVAKYSACLKRSIKTINSDSAFDSSSGLWDLNSGASSALSSTSISGTVPRYAGVENKQSSSIMIGTLMNIEGNVDPSMKGFLTNTANGMTQQLNVVANKGNKYISPL
jgi:hypothetical protein